MKVIYLCLALLGAILLVILAAAIIGIITQAINQAHAWEEWYQERQDDRKGKDI